MLFSNQVDPQAVFSDIVHTGIQTSNRFAVALRIGSGSFARSLNFHCDMAQIPSVKVKLREDYLTGVRSPLPALVGYKHSTNLFQFIIDEYWKSRTFFETWIDACFPFKLAGGRVALLEECSGEIQLASLSTKGSGGVAWSNRRYILRDCLPLEIVPAKMDAASLNTAAKFMVNIFVSNITIYDYAGGNEQPLKDPIQF